MTSSISLTPTSDPALAVVGTRRGNAAAGACDSDMGEDKICSVNSLSHEICNGQMEIEERGDGTRESDIRPHSHPSRQRLQLRLRMQLRLRLWLRLRLRLRMRLRLRLRLRPVIATAHAAKHSAAATNVAVKHPRQCKRQLRQISNMPETTPVLTLVDHRFRHQMIGSPTAKKTSCDNPKPLEENNGCAAHAARLSGSRR